MLDPREQRKGRFGAFAAREQEHQDLRVAELPENVAAAGATLPARAGAGAPIESPSHVSSKAPGRA
jgi:hypothetical protein